jgi:hypothetical protein
MAEDVECYGSTRGARYRELAAALRTLPPTVKNADARETLNAVARDYDVLPEFAERLSDPLGSVLEGSAANQ